MKPSNISLPLARLFLCCQALVLSTACNDTAGEEARAEILRIYQAQGAAHFSGKAPQFWTAVDTGFVSVANGTAEWRSKESAVESTQHYFDETVIDSISAVRSPAITVSDDNSVAWLVGQVDVYAHPRVPGSKPYSFRSAWLDVYRKEQGRWRLKVHANTERVDRH